jgi:predicted ArsR family transcriptional regulator
MKKKNLEITKKIYGTLSRTPKPIQKIADEVGVRFQTADSHLSDLVKSKKVEEIKISGIRMYCLEAN